MPTGRPRRRIVHYSMSRRSGPGSPIKDMRNKGICSASRIEAPQQVVHYDREALYTTTSRGIAP